MLPLSPVPKGTGTHVFEENLPNLTADILYLRSSVLLYAPLGSYLILTGKSISKE
jgi:hypothetical protein